MSNRPIKSYKSGQLELAMWAGEYQGKPTTSFTLSKRSFNKQTNQWEEKKYFTPTDLKDIQAICQAATVDGILNKEQKPQQTKQNIQQTFAPSPYDSNEDAGGPPW